jgi:hypothetical protein
MVVGVSFQIPAIALRSMVGRLFPAEDHSYAMTDQNANVDHQIPKGIVVTAQVMAIALLLMMVNTLEQKPSVLSPQYTGRGHTKGTGSCQ